MQHLRLLLFFFFLQSVSSLIIYCIIQYYIGNLKINVKKWFWQSGYGTIYAVTLFWQQWKHMKGLTPTMTAHSQIDADRRKINFPSGKSVRCQPTQPTQLCELPWCFQFKGENKWMLHVFFCPKHNRSDKKRRTLKSEGQNFNVGRRFSFLLDFL